LGTFAQFVEDLRGLVSQGQEVLAAGQLALHGQPEAATKQRFIEPLFHALNFDVDDYIPEDRIKGISLNWVDYALQPKGSSLLAFVEAKSLFERTIWTKHQPQVRRYIRDYLLSLDGRRQPVQWVVLSNFAELHVLNIMDREPFLSLTLDQYLENAERIWTLLEKDNLRNDLIFSDYSESRRQNLGKEFLQDLKRWRLVFANGFRVANPNLSVDQARQLSQQVLDRIILIRVLETNGLQSYYSVVREFDYWQSFTRNKDRLPFYDVLHRTFKDLELDLNTELFKDDLTNSISESLRKRGKRDVITIPNAYLEAAIIPEGRWLPQVSELLKGTQLKLTYTTPYNYDFRTLTDDIIGSVYEQFLAHELTATNGGIAIATSPELRQREGAYYTPTPVVRYLVAETLGGNVNAILQDALDQIEHGDYKSAHAAIERLSRLKVLDIACGSGAFLIEAFDVIFEAYRTYNAALRDHTTRSGAGFAALLDGGIVDNEGERVLRENIFGIDKDGQAVEVAKLNLWLKLLRSDPQRYTRTESKAPKRLPDLIKNVYVSDSLVPRAALPIRLKKTDSVHIVGNPPWGADLPYQRQAVAKYKLAAGQYDSYELFMERALELLPNGGRLGYVVPDSILHLPEHRPLRELLLRDSAVEHLIKLGEGVFEDVFRGAVAVVLQKGTPPETQRTSAAIVVKSDRKDLMHKDASGHYPRTMQALESEYGHTVLQSRFLGNPNREFDIYTKDADEPVRAKINKNPLNWGAVLWTGRGVEITKRGYIVRCPACSTWNNIPRQKKDKTYAKKVCSNTLCRFAFNYDAKAQRATIVAETPMTKRYAPFVIGENINRYRILKRLYIDTSRARRFPRCPKCNAVRASWDDLDTGSTWKCAECKTSFSRKDVTKTLAVGINYKDASFYTPPKMIVRKTGRGIYATIDDSDALTNQVVFIFRKREGLSADAALYDLYYFLGVLNSKTMLYEYYKRTADIEWKSFPYLTQETIMKLPIPPIDFSNAKRRALHQQIAQTARAAVASNGISDSVDTKIESLVMELYGLSAAEKAHVRGELAEIERYGTLLGSHEAVDDDDDDDGDAE